MKLTKLKLALVFAMIQTVSAGTLNLAEEPLYLGGVVDPNIMILLDDSGSMQKEYFPESLGDVNGDSSIDISYLFQTHDEIYGSGINRISPNVVPEYADAPFLRSSDFNTLYFNPWNDYEPWMGASGTRMADATISAAKYKMNSTGGASSPVLDLRGADYNGLSLAGNWFDDTNGLESETVVFFPITFYLYKASPNVNGKDDIANYYKIELTEDITGGGKGWYVRATEGASVGAWSSSAITIAASNLASNQSLTITPSTTAQNFANWFQYHRSRILAAKAAIGEALYGLGTNTRTGFATVNDGVQNSVKVFTGTDRSTLINNVYNYALDSDDSSPLRDALEAIGDYYSSAALDGPWATTPGTADTALSDFLTCRKSYTVLMTDGYYDSSVAASITGNVDSSQAVYDSGGPPYSDTYSGTLADVAYHYWENDLLSGVANEVSDTDENPATWQHMITHTVGLGIDDDIGSLDEAVMQAAITAGTDPGWPDPSASEENKLYDLWHAAVNARGEFFASPDSSEIISSLSSLVNTIERDGNSSASVALNSGSIYQGSELYQARFSSDGWWGELYAYSIASDGTVDTGINAEKFEAGELIDTRVAADDGASRKIAISKKIGGVSFESANLGSFATKQSTVITAAATTYAVTTANVIDYLRGSDALEGTLRNRSHYLGDIIQSSPVYVGPPTFSYPDAWTDWDGDNSEPEDSALYSAYRGSYVNRPAVIYVGANDGMMHAFAATNGEELGAVIPYGVTDNLMDLLDPGYINAHNYYVDGTPTIVDAFFDQDVTDSNYSDDDAWRTVMAFGLNAGGQSITAVDVSVPPSYTKSGTVFSKNGSAANWADSVLWEFTDEHDRDMGYSFSRPQIIRMWDGNWYVVFGNGYNNTFDNGGDLTTTNDSLTGNAVLYLARLEDDGSFNNTYGDFIKIDTGVGTDANGKPNGMSTITPIDYDGDYIVDYIYAGDMQGNVWRFNVADTNSSNWLRSQNRDKLFTAKDAGNVAQPITTRIQVISHPDTLGSFILLFGTGKYLEVGDNSSTGQQTQTFYGIWDVNGNSVPTITRSNLQQQKISAEVTISGDTYRITTANAVDWDNKYGWYMDLCVDTGSGCTNNYGERQVSDSVVRGDRIVFTTILPSTNPCALGGDSWLMELDAATGSRTSYGNFDTDGDGDFDLYSYNDPYDNSDEPVPVSLGGKKSDVGLLPTPGILSDATNQKEFKYMSGSTGQIEVVTENANQQTGTFIGRQSWQEIRMGL